MENQQILYEITFFFILNYKFCGAQQWQPVMHNFEYSEILYFCVSNRLYSADCI